MTHHGNALFHLAIPSADLHKSAEFYSKLGCRIARRYEDRVTVEFLGHQIVCHWSPEGIDPAPKMYPRHFGITFMDERQFESILATAIEQNLEFFQTPFIRFHGLPEEHRAFFLKDPSNNLLEFKYYYNPEMSY